MPLGMAFDFIGVGWLMVILGFILMFVAVALMVVGSIKGGGKVHGGGAILIGPIPIVFGTSREVVKVMLITVLAIIIIILMFTFLTVR